MNPDLPLREYELKIRKILTKARVDSPGLCARLLVANAAGLDKTAYILGWDKRLTQSQLDLLENNVKRRANGEPLAYILGHKEFYGIDFLVSLATLTPRPETEMLVDMALDLFPANAPLRFADIGCGSGCIGLALLCQRSSWQGLLVDNSLEALAICSANNRALNCSAAILAADIYKPPFPPNIFDFIVCNPPYIAYSEKMEVMAETLAHEPHSALFSSDGGLGHIKAVIQAAAHCLAPGGYLLVEHGCKQAGAIENLLMAYNYVNIQFKNDLAGLPRCATAQKNKGD